MNNKCPGKKFYFKSVGFNEVKRNFLLKKIIGPDWIRFTGYCTQLEKTIETDLQSVSMVFLNQN